MHKITVTVDVAIENGPAIKEKVEIKDVNAYDALVVEIEQGDTEVKTVEVQPTPANRLAFLLIKSSKYDNVSYGINSADEIQLDSPHLYLGVGDISRLGSEPKDLKIKSQSSEKIVLNILVGRKPTGLLVA